MWRAWLVVLGGVAGCDWVFDLQRPPEGPPDAPPSGLVAWYPMDDVVSNRVGDATGNGHDAVCVTQCPAPIVGKHDMALYFDGQDRHLQVASAVDLNTRRGFTVAAWVRLEPSAGQYACLFSKQYETMTANSWQLCTDDNVPFIDISDARMLLPPFGLAWQHVAITWDEQSRTAIGYVDGAPVDSMFVTVLFDDRPLTIGADVDFTSPFAFFKGALDDLRVYDRALAPGEIAALHQQP